MVFCWGISRKKKKTHCLGWCPAMTPEKVWSLLSDFLSDFFFRGLCQVGWCTTNLQFENLTFDLVTNLYTFLIEHIPFWLVTPFFHLEVWSGDPTNFKLLPPKKGKQKTWKKLSGSELSVGRTTLLSSTWYTGSTGDLDINSTFQLF